MEAISIYTTSAERLLETLADHTPGDVLRILTKALDIVVHHNGFASLDNASSAKLENKQRNAGKYRFLRDHEVRKFIQGYDHDTLDFMTNEKIRGEITVQFGEARTPSRSALGRYLKALRKSTSAGAASDEGIYVN